MIKCFYHRVDLDGHCSGAIVKRKYPDVELIGIDYMDGFPWEGIDREDTVFMVDFSLPSGEDMIKLYHSCNFIWIDHHESALKQANEMGYNEYINGIRKNGLAGCELTWKYLYPDEEMPLHVWLAGRYDVWQFNSVFCEEWKDIVGFEGLYQISNFGNVKSLSRSYKNQHGSSSKTSVDKLLSPAVAKNGYQFVNLAKDNVRHPKNIHRLVADHFIDNPHNYEEVNHCDCDKLNNSVTNLEWCPPQHNKTHAVDNNRKSKTSKFYGLSYNSKRKRYFVRCSIDGIRYDVGSRKNELDAAKLYDEFITSNGYDKSPYFKPLNCKKIYTPTSQYVNSDILNYQYGTRLHSTFPDNNLFWAPIWEHEEETVTDIIRDGHTILRYENIMNGRICKSQSYVVNFHNMRVLVVNRGYINSKFFDSIYDPELHDAVLNYSYIKKKNCWKISIYTPKTDEFDVSVIAKSYGGGGHKGAAGFTLDDITPLL